MCVRGARWVGACGFETGWFGLVGFRTLRGREVGRCGFRIRCGKIVVEVVVVLVAEFHGAAAHMSGGVLGASL